MLRGQLEPLEQLVLVPRVRQVQWVLVAATLALPEPRVLPEPWEQQGLQVPRALAPRDLQELRAWSGPWVPQAPRAPRVPQAPRAPREPQGLVLRAPRVPRVLQAPLDRLAHQVPRGLPVPREPRGWALRDPPALRD